MSNPKKDGLASTTRTRDARAEHKTDNLPPSFGM